MTRKKKKPADQPQPSQTLRERAEAMLRASPADITAMSAEDVQRLVHELQVHQMELEIQNEELREAQAELAHSRDRYADLYEFAPVGYVTLDKDGKILEANLTAADMLRVERRTLPGTSLSKFTTCESSDELHRHRQAVFASAVKQTCEIELLVAKGDRQVVRLESVAFEADDRRRCRTALIDVTKRKEVEEAIHRLNEELEQRVADRTAELAKREHEFRTLADNVPALFSYVDRDQRYRYVNHSYEELFRRPAGEIVGKAVVEHIGPQRYEIARPHIEAVLGGERVVYQEDFEFDDGPHTMHVQYVPDLSEDGRVQGFFTLINDLTDWKRAEQQVRLLAEAISHLGEGVLVTDDKLDWPGPRIRFVNDALCRITGYTPEELLGQTPRTLQGNGTDRSALDRIRSELSAGGSCQLELVNYRKDGTAYDAELFITPLFDPQGHRTNFVSIHRDITERKRIERALQDSEDRLRAILDTAADAIITIDRRGMITNANAATERMFGYAQQQLVGRNVNMLMPSPYAIEHDGYLRRYLESGEARIIGVGREVVGRRKDGSTFPVGLAVSEIEHLQLFTGIVRDISTVKELQKQLLEIAAEEGRRIGHELHDNIQQQLTGLGLLAQSLAESFATEATERVEQAETAARLARGIRQSAADVHSLARGLVPVNIDAQGLRSALTQFASTVREQYDVDCDFHCDTPVELADNFAATHLYRIVQEAVTNAVKHGRAGKIRISLTEGEETVTLKVVDNGIGISEKRNARPGMGLRIMQHRAGLIGATLHIGPVREGGTEVRCTVLRNSAGLR